MELGKKQTLYIVKNVKFGVYLAEENDPDAVEKVLLPLKQVPEGSSLGDQITVFLYKDSDDRMIATVHEPALTLGQISGRLCATMKVYPYLSTRSPYGIGDEVQGRVYELSDNFGVFVAVDDTYSALIPAREAAGKYTPGQILSLRVTGVKEDGKLDVSDRQKAYLQINEDAEAVLLLIEDYGGVLPFDDKASPEIIKEEAGLTKNAFKRAVGHLLKEKKAEIRDGKIYRI